MKALKYSFMALSIFMFATSAHAIHTPGFMKKIFPDKNAEYYEKKQVPFAKRSKQLQEETDKLGYATVRKDRAKAIAAAQNIVASPLLTTAEKRGLALETANRIVRWENNLERGIPFTAQQNQEIQKISGTIYRQHGW